MPSVVVWSHVVIIIMSSETESNDEILQSGWRWLGSWAVRPLRHLTVTDVIAKPANATSQPMPSHIPPPEATHNSHREAYLVSKERRRLAAKRGVQVYS